MPPVSSIRRRLTEACLELVAIPSVTGEEQEITASLERWALSHPTLTRDDVIRHGNALIIGQLHDHLPCIALVGHTDTVPPAPGYAGPTQSADGTKVVGLGASDMKGAIAVMQVLYEHLDIDSLPFSLLLVLYDREEGPYAQNGLQPLLESYDSLRDIDLAIAMEPTDNALQLGCVGSIQARVVFRGRAAHSARPWQGDNAIHRAGPFLTALASRPFREVEIEGLVFREAISATLARGGRARNVVPDLFELNVNFRFAPLGSPADAVERALAELREVAGGPPGNGQVEVLDVAPPGSIPADNPILQHIQHVCELPVEPKQAWTDVARLSAHGIDAVNLGPGTPAQAHQAGEWIDIDAMVRCYEMLHRVLTTPMEGT